MQKNTLFIYYKLLPSLGSETRKSLTQLFDDVLKHHPGISLEVMKRPDLNSEGQETWMEIYRHKDGISEALIHDINTCAQKHGLPMPRKSEFFIPLD